MPANGFLINQWCWLKKVPQQEVSDEVFKTLSQHQSIMGKLITNRRHYLE